MRSQPTMSHDLAPESSVFPVVVIMPALLPRHEVSAVGATIFKVRSETVREVRMPILRYRNRQAELRHEPLQSRPE